MRARARPQVIGRYAIYGKIAQGGVAAVHLGRQQGAAGFSRTVAIKRLHPHLADEPEFLATMIDEARLAARIHHPNVVPTLDVVAEGGEFLVVMEYVRGDSLARLLKAQAARRRRVPLSVASAIMLGALHGLHAAHEATGDGGVPLGIVHRDVSPQNILIGVDGLARIIDFGVAKGAGRVQTTREGVIKGKIAYMAPEQLSGLECTRRIDVYAMGVVLWHLLTGRALFSRTSEVAVVAQVLAGATEPPSRHVHGLPAGLDDLVMTALAHEPADRFATAREMADRLVHLVPPALPSVVGAWVKDLAGVALSERAAALAEIESGAAPASVRPPTSGAEAEAAVFASPTFSPKGRTPPENVSTRSRWPRGRLAAIACGAAVLSFLFAVAWHGRAASGETSSAAAAAATMAATTAPPPAPESDDASAVDGPVQSVVAFPAANSVTCAPAVPPAAPRPAPRRHHDAAPAQPGGMMVRFPQPD